MQAGAEAFVSAAQPVFQPSLPPATIRLGVMDRVRFGRALGSGTREAARALARAAEAARAPNPAERVRGAGTGPHSANQQPPNLPPRTGRLPDRKAIGRGSAQLGRSVFGPLRKASGVLWFEFTGSFFGLFALAMAAETWKRRGELHPGVVLHGHAWLAPVMLVIFGYFAVSSFVRASRRGKR